MGHTRTCWGLWDLVGHTRTCGTWRDLPGPAGLGGTYQDLRDLVGHTRTCGTWWAMAGLAGLGGTYQDMAGHVPNNKKNLVHKIPFEMNLQPKEGILGSGMDTEVISFKFWGKSSVVDNREAYTLNSSPTSVMSTWKDNIMTVNN